MYYFYKNTKIGYLTLQEDNSKIIKIVFGKKHLQGGFKFTDSIEKAFIQIEEYLNKKRKIFDIEYELKGSTFQKKVWNELKNIPYGKTSSYKEIAQKINNKNSYRAVGTANNKNPLPIIIPCHRVIRQNGELSGYSGGANIKKFLLNMESN